ncbi:PepSY domain-containing protein [Psychrobacter urativorans]|uniref:PepSY domain-containing protein n=1 Tax=Psychrobacter urativorans TaxID=45610 RepID=A0A0M4U583_9GAMM|nr:PepSY domain-containing protein [Psychrobacter urativorans]ALF58801.1 hypothetical protein AOC03_01000 [Psychrobacter urativorans]
MSLPLLKPLLLTVGATSLVFFGGVIALSVQSPEPTNTVSASNIIAQKGDNTSTASELSSFKAVTNPLSQSAQTSSLAALTAEQAIAFAKQDAPDAILQATPELINYNGAVAYEVILDSGATYVDANLGAVLNPVGSNQSNPFGSEYDGYKDKHHDDKHDDKHKRDKHHSKKHDDKHDKESGRLITTSYQLQDEDNYDD